jgi:hypothetical protein
VHRADPGPGLRPWNLVVGQLLTGGDVEKPDSALVVVGVRAPGRPAAAGFVTEGHDLAVPAEAGGMPPPPHPTRWRSR